MENRAEWEITASNIADSIDKVLEFVGMVACGILAGIWGITRVILAGGLLLAFWLILLVIAIFVIKVIWFAV